MQVHQTELKCHHTYKYMYKYNYTLLWKTSLGKKESMGAQIMPFGLMQLDNY